MPFEKPAELLSAARETLRVVFGYPEFRGAQAEIISHVIGGGDALVLMPTGGGKSLCYQLPALQRPGVAIVVSPLIALMQDQVEQLKLLGIAAASLHSGLEPGQAGRVERALLGGQLRLLYVAPERLLGERMLDLLARSSVSLFAIDEAHCVSQWGHDFRPEYQQLKMLHERFPDVPRLALTATADPATRQEIIEQLGLQQARVFVSSFDRPNIRLTVTEKERPRAQLQAFLDTHRGSSGIVYCGSRKKVDETAAMLNEAGTPALGYHAGMDSNTRAQNQRRFSEADDLIMVATVAFGMGIDKPDVRFVAHLDLPKSLEGYYQELGRAGRDGDPADAWLCFGLGDVVQQRRFIDDSDASDERKRFERSRLEQLLGFAETSECRRVALLRYFGENFSGPCGNCDNCLSPEQRIDATEPARKLLSAIYRTGQRFGAGHVFEVLRGGTNEAIARYGHQRLSVYGIGREHDERFWRSVLRQLVTRSLVQVDHEAYGALKLDPSCGPLLRGESTLELKPPSAKPSARERKVKSAKQPTSAPASSAAQARFEKLRIWRKSVASEQGVPPYVIFHDRTLLAIAEAEPRALADLAEVSGVGKAKLERFGEALLGLLRER